MANVNWDGRAMLRKSESRFRVMQINGHYTVQDHSSSPSLSVPIESPYATASRRLLLTAEA